MAVTRLPGNDPPAEADGAGSGVPGLDAVRGLVEAAALHEGRGDLRAALDAMRRAQVLQQRLLERAVAAAPMSADDDRERLVQLNEALQRQMTETELLHARLREQALRDPLTGLHNRRYLFEVAPGLLDLARRQASPLTLALLDLDHFKSLNDGWGHSAGDAVLQRFAELLTHGLRRSDLLCRHGGEEFVVVMPDQEAEDAGRTLGRVLRDFCGERIVVGRRRLPSCSFSGGVAVFPTHGDTLEQLLSRADRALYQAKDLGRARIETLPTTGFATLT